MVTKVTLTATQKAEIELLTGHKVDHLEVKPKVTLTLTDDQQKLLKDTLGQQLVALELNEFDLKNLSAAMPYEAGLTVGLGKK